MPFKKLLLLLITPFFLLACQSKEEPETREKALSRGFDMMDEGRYGEAIQYFAKLNIQDPHYHVKLALASAYAGRAGVRIENIYAFVKAPKTSTTSGQVTGIKFDKQTELIFQNLNSYLAQWQKVPELSLEGRSDIRSALAVIEDNAEPGVRLYSGALRIVLTKSLVQEGVENWQVSSQHRMCGKYLKPMFQWALKLLENLSALTADLEASFPSQAVSYKEAREQLDALRGQAKGWTLPKEDECF